ncbi:MAG TPA: hypothetical protein VEY12_02825 [Thermoplasmata archaeon]|nr:hypothetical protein [Thermoplasmata archaeon]
MSYRAVLGNRRFVLYLAMTAADNMGYSLSIVAIPIASRWRTARQVLYREPP